MARARLEVSFQLILHFSDTFSNTIIEHKKVALNEVKVIINSAFHQAASNLNVSIEPGYCDSRGIEVTIRSCHEIVLSKVINTLKSASSRRIKRAINLNDRVWDRGYFAFSVGSNRLFEDWA